MDDLCSAILQNSSLLVSVRGVFECRCGHADASVRSSGHLSEVLHPDDPVGDQSEGASAALRRLPVEDRQGQRRGTGHDPPPQLPLRRRRYSVQQPTGASDEGGGGFRRSAVRSAIPCRGWRSVQPRSQVGDGGGAGGPVRMQWCCKGTLESGVGGAAAAAAEEKNESSAQEQAFGGSGGTAQLEKFQKLDSVGEQLFVESHQIMEAIC